MKVHHLDVSSCSISISSPFWESASAAAMSELITTHYKSLSLCSVGGYFKTKIVP